MPSWKKVAVSGSDTSFSSLFITNAVTASAFTGSFVGNGSGLTNLTYGDFATGSFVAQATWSFTHNLGFKYAAIEVYDQNDFVIIPSETKIIDAQSVEIRFTSPQTGTALATLGTGVVSGSVFDPSALLTKASFNTYTGSATSQFAGTASFARTASFAQNALSSSYAQTASYSQNLQISGSINNVDYIDFDKNNIIGTNEPAWKEGRVFYDSGSGALAVYNWEADVTLNVGQEQWLRARNQTGATITNGSVVRLSGAIGDRPTVVLAQATDQTNTFGLINEIIGLATHDIENGTDGFITTFGIVNGLNTSAFTAGDLLWVSQSAGQFTNVAPPPPFDKTFVGVVTRVNVSNGSVFTTPQIPIHFHDLSSVSASIYQQGDLWMYRSGSVGQVNAWINTKALAGSYSISGSLTITGSANISSSLTASAFTIATQPTTSYTTRQILMRNATSGQVEITNSTSPAIYNFGMSYAMSTFNYLT